ncbi:unnamed protein product [Ambrosiozyma monospora]|uniref:Unnamed protein product n=1 Tax=Ambrosiozyma monospora TaxID=43982 RepID=A0A9W6W8T1_AMBMO|nr:unnamed protein product [Ambrosiozyma monospora]
MEPTSNGIRRRRRSPPNMNSQSDDGEYLPRAPGVEGSKNLEKMATDVEHAIKLTLKNKERDQSTKLKSKKESNSVLAVGSRKSARS